MLYGYSKPLNSKKKKSQIKIKLNIAVDNVTNEVIIVIVQPGRKNCHLCKLRGHFSIECRKRNEEIIYENLQYMIGKNIVEPS